MNLHETNKQKFSFFFLSNRRALSPSTLHATCCRTEVVVAVDDGPPAIAKC